MIRKQWTPAHQHILQNPTVHAIFSHRSVSFYLKLEREERRSARVSEPGRRERTKGRSRSMCSDGALRKWSWLLLRLKKQVSQKEGRMVPIIAEDQPMRARVPFLFLVMALV